jgi:ribose/xylose/arabinose/galactoside ABC-type transport system permease subunit
MNLTGIPSTAQPLVVGFFIIAMVLLDSLARHRSERV